MLRSSPPRLQKKEITVQAFVAKSSVKTLDICMFHGFPGPNEIALDVVAVSKGISLFRNEYAPAVDRDRVGQTMALAYLA